MAVDPKLNNAAVQAQRAYNNAVASLAASQQAIATITARGGTATAAQTAALAAAQNAVKSSQMALNAAKNDVAVAAGTTGKAVSPAVDPGAKQQQPYTVRTTTGTGPTLSSSDGLLNIVGATALAAAAANPLGTASLVGSLFSSAKDILGVGGTTSSTTAPPAASNISESVFDPGPPTQDTAVNPTSDPSQFPAYDDDGNLQPGFAINDETGGTYYQGFERNTDRPVNPASDPSQFPAYDDDGNLQPGFAINDETGGTYYRGFELTTDRPVNPASNPSQFPAYDDDGNLQPGFAINDETGDTYYRGFEITTDRPVNPASDPSQFPAYDDDGNLQPGFKINDETGDTYYQGFERNTNQPLSPTADPSQFPAYDDDGNLQPGFAINDETGDTYYRGLGPPTQQTAGFDPNYDEFGGLDAAIAQQQQTATPVSDPYYGLTPEQLQQLGGADPTDPYIRARLGIPQLTESPIAATPGFGTIKTGVPLIDNALGFLGGLFGGSTPTPPTPSAPAVAPQSDPSQFPAYDDDGNLQPGFAINEETGDTYYRGFPANDVTNQPVNPASDPSQFPAYDDDGNLQPGFAINEETGGTYYRGFPGDNVTNQPVNPASDPSQFPAYDDDGNLQPGFAINEETGDTYYRGLGPPISATTQTLTDEETAALFDGDPNVVTPAEKSAQTAQTAADAAALYPGTDNTNLKNINEASGAIAQNEAGIANAQDIISRNNAELADPDISDERRAELEANNASQENYIRLAEDNTAENELIIESNADSFAAGGGNPDSGQGPDEVAAFEDPGLQENVFDPGVGQPVSESVFDPTQDVGENVFDPGETINADGESVFDPENVEPNSDPFEQARFEAELEADIPASEIVLTADEQAAADDPFEQRRLELEQEANREQLAMEATDVEPGVFTGQSDEFGGVDEAVAIQQADIDTRNDPALSEEEIQAELDRAVESDTARDVELSPEEVDAEIERAAAEGAEQFEPAAVDATQDPTLTTPATGVASSVINPDEEEAAAEKAAKFNTTQQATLQARYKQPSNEDWRVRISLSAGSDYLYKVDPKEQGILAPLAKTNGVVFPYTPSIETNYVANYEKYDLVHSNYRGAFYKNSAVNDISIRGTFTAQDTSEASYMLAVIHFFRSVTKMFYGKDSQRGAPPPLVYLTGFGDYQFAGHPCVVTNFSYSLPSDVDYIRANNPNNYGTDLLNRRDAALSSPTAFSGQNARQAILSAVGIPFGATPQKPTAGPITNSVTNTARATYVPTKIEINVILLPMQTRDQISKQFSLKEFANGKLIQGGFW